MYRAGILLGAVFAAASCVNVVAKNSAASRAGERLVFDESFNSFDLGVWKHEITMAGGGNWEFQYYTNNRSNSFVEDGVLHLQPTPTADLIGDACVTGEEPFTMSLWGLNPADHCTSNAYYGCERASNKPARLAINPVQSARISTAGRFHIKYGRVEVEAKLPVGDWLWPAIWLLPEHNAYGSWPASGEIDLVESRGNARGYCPNGKDGGAGLCPGGNDVVSSTLHWGPYPALNGYPRTTGSVSLDEGKSFGDDFHKFGLSWDESGLYTYLDEEENRIMSVDFDQSFWERGEYKRMSGIDNPWAGRPNSAPFDSGFYLVMNVAVGGVGGFFPDNQGGKPWSDHDQDAPLKFWEAKDEWHPTWKAGDSALQVKSVRIWQKPGGEHYKKDDCDCAAGRQEVTDSGGTGSQDSEPSSPGKGASVDASMQPPTDAEGTFRFMMVLTVFNTLILLTAMAFWGSSAFRRQCASCGWVRKKRQREAGYRLAESTMPGSDEVEMR